MGIDKIYKYVSNDIIKYSEYIKYVGMIKEIKEEEKYDFITMLYNATVYCKTLYEKQSYNSLQQNLKDLINGMDEVKNISSSKK